MNFLGPSYVLIGALNLMATGMALVIALRIAYGGRVPVADPIYAMVRGFGITMVAFGWMVILVSIGFMLGVIWFFVSLTIALMVWRQIRLTRQRAHLALLALAVEKQISLPACIDAFATEQGGRFASRAGNFSADLRSGMPLPQAIAASRGVLPRYAELEARIGQACGKLGPALRDAMSSHGGYEPIRRELASRMMYFFVAFAALPMITSFLFIKIVPAFVKIFNDFDVELPAATVFVVQVANNPWLQLLSFWAFIGGFIMLLLATGWYVGFPLPQVPILRRLFLRSDRATIERALAFPAEQQQPLEPMIDVLQQNHPSSFVRKRLRRAAARMESGQNWITSLRSQSLLGKADVAVLSSAQRVGNLPWALREMADSNERRLLNQLQAWVQLGSIAVVLVLALIVFVVAVAFFTPMVKLIMSLT